jgi:hypothetical protein
MAELFEEKNEVKNILAYFFTKAKSGAKWPLKISVQKTAKKPRTKFTPKLTPEVKFEQTCQIFIHNFFLPKKLQFVSKYFFRA